MSIRDRQLQKAEDQVIDKALRSGYTPTLSEVQTGVTARLADRPPGLPTFQLREIVKGERSDAGSFNTMMESLCDDLDTAFREALVQGNRMMSVADLYETQKRQVQIELRALAAQSAALLERARAQVSQGVVFDSFTDFRQVEFDGDVQRNIPGTTAYINLETGEALIDYAVRNSGLIDLSGARAHIKPQQAKRIDMTGQLANIFNDTINEAFTYTIYKPTPDPVAVELNIDTGRPLRANQVKMDFQSPKRATVRLSLSLDGKSYIDTPATEYGAPLVWNFTETEFQHMRFTIVKDTPNVTDGADYGFGLGIKRISALNVNYKESAYLVSQSHEVNKVISTLTLVVDSVLPPETAMRYYVALDRAKEGMDWREIRPGIPLSMDQVTLDSLEINQTTPGYGDFVRENLGVKLYKLGAIPVVPKSLVLMEGDYMWQVETRPATLAADYVPTMADWRDVPVYRIAFIGAERTMLPLQPNALQRFTSWLYTEQDSSEERVTTSLTQAGGMSVYLNNTLIKPVGGVYTYRFKAGWNQLQICTFTQGSDVSVKPGLYLDGVAERVFGRREPLRQVTTEGLIHSSSQFDRSLFALSGTDLLVAYDPVALDLDAKGVRYFLEYEYIPEGARPANVRVMAIMNRKPAVTDSSPRLRSYKLLVE